MDANMIVYLGIAAAILALALWCLVSEERPAKQATAAMVIIPLLLRILLVK